MIRRTITIDEDLNRAIQNMRADYMRKYSYSPDIDFTKAITRLAKEGLKHLKEFSPEE